MKRSFIEFKTKFNKNCCFPASKKTLRYVSLYFYTKCTYLRRNIQNYLSNRRMQVASRSPWWKFRILKRSFVLFVVVVMNLKWSDFWARLKLNLIWFFCFRLKIRKLFQPRGRQPPRRMQATKGFLPRIWNKNSTRIEAWKRT